MKYKVIRSDRKTISIEVNKDCEIIIRAPKSCGDNAVKAFAEKYEAWAERAVEKTRQRQKNAAEYEINDSDREKYIETAQRVLPKKTEYWSKIMGLSPSYVKITSAEKRYGSCNSKNGICYSYRLAAYPEKAMDYVVIHELAHIKYKNHGKEFYSLIEKYMPDYKEAEKILRHKGG